MLLSQIHSKTFLVTFALKKYQSICKLLTNHDTLKIKITHVPALQYYIICISTEPSTSMNGKTNQTLQQVTPYQWQNKITFKQAPHITYMFWYQQSEWYKDKHFFCDIWEVSTNTKIRKLGTERCTMLTATDSSYCYICSCFDTALCMFFKPFVKSSLKRTSLPTLEIANKSWQSLQFI